MRRVVCLSFMICALLLFLSCSGSSPVSGTETTNGMVCVAVSSCDSTIYGNAPEGVELILASADYNPVENIGYSSKKVSSGSRKFDFSNLEPGDYNLIAKLDPGDSGTAFTGLKIADSDSVETLRDTSFISKTYSIRGRVVKEYADTVNLFVYLAGTLFYDTADSSEGFEISGIPRGRFDIISFIAIKGGDITPPQSTGDTLSITIDEGKDLNSVELEK